MTRDAFMFARHNGDCRMPQADLAASEARTTAKERSIATSSAFVGRDAGSICSLAIKAVCPL